MKRIIWSFVFLICLSIVYAGPVKINSSFAGVQNNSVLGNTLNINFQTPRLIDWANTTANIDFAEGFGEVDYLYECKDNAEGSSVSACWTTSAGVVTSTTVGGYSSAKSLDIGLNALRYNPTTNKNMTVTGWIFGKVAYADATVINLNDITGSPKLGMTVYGTSFTSPACRYGQFDWSNGNLCTSIASDDRQWTYFKSTTAKGDSYDFLLGNNFSSRDNFSQAPGASSDLWQSQQGASSANYMDDIKIRNDTPNRNSSATLIAFTPVNFSNTFSQVTFFYYGSGVDLIFSCNNLTPTQKISVNNSATPTACAGVQVSQQLTAWINLSGGDASNVTYVNITVSLAGPDTTPPSITYYNLTNGNGCESWNTNKNTACSTSSVIPTVQFNTSENAWCAIAGSSNSVSLDKNYTDMGSSRNCTGDMAGEGSTLNHRCTLTPQDELVYDTSYLFISCKDSSGNQNLTSTSGPLKLSIIGLETTRRDSIGLAIQNALLSGYTNYTDQQIYARNLSNGQVKGTFDRAAKKGSKMWAFNGIGVSDSYVNMFNLTPVLYTLEFANMTSTRITNLTELMINATR